MGARVRAITASRHVATTSYDAVSSAPAIRWEASDGLDVRALYGAFMQQIDQFDQTAFHLPPAEADVMDPHQRLALEEGYAALNAAGLHRGSLMNSVTGVFGGLWPSDYSSVLPTRGALGRGPFAVAATGPAMIVGRLSYTLGMQGPSIAFDTACSASLSAFHAAIYAQDHRDCDASLVLGVNVMCSSGISQLFAAAQMTSPTGKSHTFDARADGYARGEACCCVTLLPGSRGLQRVRCDAGIVRQDGRSASLTAPNGTAQQALLRAALSIAGRPTRGAFLLEAHGTGTRLGDLDGRPDRGARFVCCAQRARPNERDGVQSECWAYGTDRGNFRIAAVDAGNDPWIVQPKCSAAGDESSRESCVRKQPMPSCAGEPRESNGGVSCRRSELVWAERNNCACDYMHARHFVRGHNCEQPYARTCLRPR